jgi:9-cis-epoxycarotenoid dioxygenase
MVATHQPVQPNVLTGAGSGPGGAIAKVDTKDPSKTEIYSFLPHEFVGEPIFVAKRGTDVTKTEQEDKGYILTQVVDGNTRTTDLVILDAEGTGALLKGPVARLRLPTFIPFGLHGIFVDDLTFEF